MSVIIIMAEGQEVSTQIISPASEPAAIDAINPIQPVENPNIAKINVFLSQFNIPLDKLSQPLLNQYQNLIEGKKVDGAEMTDEEYRKYFSDFLTGVKKSSTELNISPESMAAIDKISQSIVSGEIASQDIVTSLKGYLESEPKETGMKPEEQKAAIEELSRMEEELKKPEPQRNKETLKFGFEKVLKFIKMLGAAILGLFGISIWRALGETMKGSSQQRQ